MILYRVRIPYVDVASARQLLALETAVMDPLVLAETHKMLFEERKINEIDRSKATIDRLTQQLFLLYLHENDTVPSIDEETLVNYLIILLAFRYEQHYAPEFAPAFPVGRVEVVYLPSDAMDESRRDMCDASVPLYNQFWIKVPIAPQLLALHFLCSQYSQLDLRNISAEQFNIEFKPIVDVKMFASTQYLTVYGQVTSSVVMPETVIDQLTRYFPAIAVTCEQRARWIPESEVITSAHYLLPSLAVMAARARVDVALTVRFTLVSVHRLENDLRDYGARATNIAITDAPVVRRLHGSPLQHDFFNMMHDVYFHVMLESRSSLAIRALRFSVIDCLRELACDPQLITRYIWLACLDFLVIPEAGDVVTVEDCCKNLFSMGYCFNSFEHEFAKIFVANPDKRSRDKAVYDLLKDRYGEAANNPRLIYKKHPISRDLAVYVPINEVYVLIDYFVPVNRVLALKIDPLLRGGVAFCHDYDVIICYLDSVFFAWAALLWSIVTYSTKFALVVGGGAVCDGVPFTREDLYEDMQYVSEREIEQIAQAMRGHFSMSRFSREAEKKWQRTQFFSAFPVKSRGLAEKMLKDLTAPVVTAGAGTSARP